MGNNKLKSFRQFLTEEDGISGNTDTLVVQPKRKSTKENPPRPPADSQSVCQ